MGNDLVSVIMPSFGTAKYIAESIRSVLDQTYKNLELIIVDDNSSDGSAEIISEFTDERIRFFRNSENLGAAFTRNKALDEAKGRWIAFLDSDDIWANDKLEKQIGFMEKNGYAFSYTDYEKIDDDGNSLKVYCTGPKVVTRRKMYRYGYPGCLTVMYDAEKIGKIRIEDIKKNNDYAMWLIVCKKADCYLLPENLAKYRIRTVSISHDKFSKKVRSHYDLFRKCDKRSAITSLWFTLRNLFYGFLKKQKYEKKIK